MVSCPKDMWAAITLEAVLVTMVMLNLIGLSIAAYVISRRK
ncbi:MAG TPA: hypothetical protein VN673_18910 [Clostridia bacterium]|nr:hypothetical protein [Clostridia bacterium]